MATTPDQLREWASNLTDWEIFDIVKPGENEHLPDAIEAAKEEFDRRHLSWALLSKRDEDTKRRAYGDDAYLKKCANCGKATPYEVPRLLPIIGNKRIWFCEHCSAFLGGDPSKSLLAGCGELIGGIASCVLAVVLGRHVHTSSSAQGILMLVGFVTMGDAVSRIANAAKGISRKAPSSNSRDGIHPKENSASKACPNCHSIVVEQGGSCVKCTGGYTARSCRNCGITITSGVANCPLCGAQLPYVK